MAQTRSHGSRFRLAQKAGGDLDRQRKRRLLIQDPSFQLGVVDLIQHRPKKRSRRKPRRDQIIAPDPRIRGNAGKAEILEFDLDSSHQRRIFRPNQSQRPLKAVPSSQSLSLGHAGDGPGLEERVPNLPEREKISLLSV